MHLKSLKIFCDVVSRRSFSRAADENGISQSGASQIVHQLEENLGVKVFDRSKRPFGLTPEGEVYYDGCRKLVKRFAALEEEVRTLQQEVAGRVSIASIYSVGLSHMKHYVQEFLEQYPKSEVGIEYQQPDQVYELVDQDRVDLGLVSFPKSSRSIESLAWREERMVLACSATHRFASRENISLEELQGETMVGFVTSLRIRREIDRTLGQHDVELKLAMEFDNLETIKRAVEINTGISLLPEPTLQREVAVGSLRSIPLQDEPLTRPLGIIHRRGKVLGATARRFIQFLQVKAGESSNNGSNSVSSHSNGNGVNEGISKGNSNPTTNSR